MNFFSVEHIALTLFSYPLSYVELIATVFGLASVILAARSNVLTWPSGIVNECGLFLVFFQVQLYADMFLQVFFLFVTLYGWRYWRQPGKKDIEVITPKQLAAIFLLLAVATALLGFLTARLHMLLPAIFPREAASPYLDSLVTSASVIATVLLAKKILQTWVLWLLVDILSVGLFYSRGVYFIALLYAVFFVVAIYGYSYWRKQLV